MEQGFWIWKRRLTEVLEVISDKGDFDINQPTLDKIKHGLTGTSDEKDNWFDFKLGRIYLKISYDQDDIDILHIQLTGLDDKEIEQLSVLGTQP